jgi:hypothetical protein
MTTLNNVKIYRGGLTAHHLSLETEKCSFYVNQRDNSIEFRFNLASKGGGTTVVLLRVGMGDLPDMLQEVATKLPEQVGVFSECATIANKQNLGLLVEARRVQKSERTRAEALIEKLEKVEEFVSEKYYEALVGEDEVEAAVKERLEEVVNDLRAVS